VELGRYSELLVSLGWREGSGVRNLKVVVYPPPRQAILDLAWVAGSNDTLPMEFHCEGPATVWRRRGLGLLGKGTATLEFILGDRSFGGYTVGVGGS